MCVSSILMRMRVYLCVCIEISMHVYFEMAMCVIRYVLVGVCMNVALCGCNRRVYAHSTDDDCSAP